MKAKAKAPPKKERAEEVIVRLRVICIKPPRPENYGADFGMQDNSTTKEWVLNHGKNQPGGDVHFECECRVRKNPTNGKPNFLGSFVHGGTADRFLYLSWRPKDWRPGSPDVGNGVWLRRMKIRLGSIGWSQIRQSAGGKGVLEKKVEGTGPSGPFGSPEIGVGGWTLRKK
jgi:hypothetical protein